MQTFLPLVDFEASARILDRQRLGKQRLEALHILRVLRGETEAWAHHPAVKMWRGYDYALMAYYIAICEEWKRRGYKHTMPLLDMPHKIIYPAWLGDFDFHYAHKSKLYFKAPHLYPQWVGIEQVPYIWPS